MEVNLKLNPIGVIRKDIWLLKVLCDRRDDVESATTRYRNENVEIPPEWIDELFELNKKINKLMIKK